VAIACTLAFAVARTNWVRSLENIYYDYWHVFSGVRYRPRHAAFVSMDDETLAALKDEPIAFWGPHFGRAMDTLTRAGVKAVGLDFIYLVSAENWLNKLNLPDSEISRNFDSPLRAALARGDMILITHLVERKGGELQMLLPPEDHLLLLPGGIHDLGIANLHADDDKHVRHFFPLMNVAGDVTGGPEVDGQARPQPASKLLNVGRRRVSSLTLCIAVLCGRCVHSEVWRRGSESNRRGRLCRPLHDHSATPPGGRAFKSPQRRLQAQTRRESRRSPWGEIGAGKESRTPDLNLGKVALYQLSYSRVEQPLIIAQAR
jgi:CHASE2 domain